jgi:sugar lactone lactonase YvrE
VLVAVLPWAPATAWAADTFYLANQASHTIVKYGAAGGTATNYVTSPLLDGPTGLAFDAAGNLFVACIHTDTIVKVTPGGTASVFASGLNDPLDMVFDKAGNLFVANSRANSILKFTPAGAQSVFASGLADPVGLAFDSAGYLYTDNWNAANVMKFAPDGTASVFVNTGFDGSSGDIAFDASGNLYVVNFASIDRYSPAGVKTAFATSQSVNLPVGLAFDSGGNILVSNAGLGNIVKYTPGGAWSTWASNAGGSVMFLTSGPLPEPSAATSLLLGIGLAVGRRGKRAR